MGGSTQEKTTTTSQSNAFGQSSQQRQQQQQAQQQQQSGASSQTTTPWDATGGLLTSILNQLGGIPAGPSPLETTALNLMSSSAQAGNPYAPAIGGVATELLGGGPDRSGLVSDAYQQYQRQLSPYLNADYLNPYTTPGFSNAFDKMTGDIANQINGQFAAAGRDLSGLNQQALARGLTQGAGQLIQNQYNQNVANQLGAINSLYGAGNTTAGLFSTLDQARLGNMKAGIGAADAANAAQMWGPTQMLAIEAQRRGIPLQTLAAQYGMVLPAAQAFATRTGATSGSESGTSSAYGSSSGTAAGTSSGQGTQNTTTSTPFNPLSLLPLAFAPLSGGASLAGMGASALGGGLFSALSNGFMGPGSFRPTGG